MLEDVVNDTEASSGSQNLLGGSANEGRSQRLGGGQDLITQVEP